MNETSPMLNGINTSNMSSSRSRERRHSSAGRKSFSSEDDSPIHIPVNADTKSNTEISSDFKKSKSSSSILPKSSANETKSLGNGPKSLKSSDYRSNGRVNNTKANRDSDIKVDIGSLLNEISSFEDELTAKKDTVVSSKSPSTRTGSSELRDQSAKTASNISTDKSTSRKSSSTADEIKRTQEIASRKSSTTADEIKRSPSHTKFGEELPIYSIRSKRRSFNKTEDTPEVTKSITKDHQINGESPKSPHKNSTAPMESVTHHTASHITHHTAPMESVTQKPSRNQTQDTSLKSPRKDYTSSSDTVAKPHKNSDINTATTQSAGSSGRGLTDKPRPPPLKTEYNISREEEEQLSARGVVSQSRRRESVLQNGHPEFQLR